MHLKNFLTSYNEYLLTLPLPVNARESLYELQNDYLLVLMSEFDRVHYVHLLQVSY